MAKNGTRKIVQISLTPQARNYLRAVAALEGMTTSQIVEAWVRMEAADRGLTAATTSQVSEPVVTEHLIAKYLSLLDYPDVVAAVDAGVSEYVEASLDTLLGWGKDPASRPNIPLPN